MAKMVFAEIRSFDLDGKPARPGAVTLVVSAYWSKGLHAVRLTADGGERGRKSNLLMDAADMAAAVRLAVAFADEVFANPLGKVAPAASTPAG